MKSLFLIGLLLCCGEISENDLRRRAEEHFAEGLRLRDRGERGTRAFRACAEALEELRRQGVDNPLLEQNLGNAYLLAGDLPRAILAYRRGLRLAPGDAALRARLALARERVVFAEGSSRGRIEEPAGENGLPYLSTTTLYTLTILCYGLGLLSLTRAWMRRARAWVWSGALLLVLAAGLGLLLMQRMWTPERPLVVLAKDGVLLRKGNSKLFPAWFAEGLNRGVEATLLHEQEGWCQIELSTGEVGWVAEEDVVRDDTSGTRESDRKE